MLRIQVGNKRESQAIDHPAGPIEFGRGPKVDDVVRCVVQDLSVSRNHMRLEEISWSSVRVTNLSEKNPIRLDDGSAVAPSDTVELAVPVRLHLGETAVDVDIIQDGSIDNIDRRLLETLGQPPVRASASKSKTSLQNLGEAPNAERLAQWFEWLIAVQRSSVSSDNFFQQTAEALVDLVGLDKGLVLLRRGRDWVPVGRAVVREGGFGRDFSTRVLNHVCEERITLFQAQANMESFESLQGVEAVVASPIFDGKEQVVGVLYGTRNRYTKGRGIGVGKLEAQIVQVLASAVGAGLARQEHAVEAARRKVQLEQVFSPSLAQEVIDNPSILESGQEREVTVLFTDIRGFSKMSEELAVPDVFSLVRDVMNCATRHVVAEDGVVVDYYGDGLCAMWNAPKPQPDHAARACRAALGVIQELPQVAARWREKLGRPLAVGLGLNTGKALVGNTGSDIKIKYGPFGHTVNQTQRVEGATKHFGVAALITDTTYELVKRQFATRRIGKARLAGMERAVTLYELYAEQPTPEWERRRDAYEAALDHFEKGNYAAACKGLFPYLSGVDERAVDLSCLTLISRAVECMRAPPPKDFDPAWNLTGK